MASPGNIRMEPNWARVPPHVPTYPNPPAYFRQTPANVYTAPADNKGSYQKWWSKWHWDQPEWKEEHYRHDSRTPVMRKISFQPGTERPPYRESCGYPAWRQEYRCQGVPETEVTRARAINRTHWAKEEKRLYQFSNAMTSTQYKKPVTSAYGPLLREEVYGLKTQRNRHGFMPFQDYYF